MLLASNWLDFDDPQDTNCETNQFNYNTIESNPPCNVHNNS